MKHAEPPDRPLAANGLAFPGLRPSVVVGSLAINLLGLGVPLMTLQVYDRIIPNRSIDTLTVMIIALGGVFVLDVVLRSARAYLTGWSTAQFEHAAAVAAVQRILEAPPRVIESEPVSAFLNRFNALDTLRAHYGGQSWLLLLDVPFVAVFLGLIGVIGGSLALIPVVTLGLLGAISLRHSSGLKATLERRLAQDERRYGFIVEALAGIRTLKAMAMEPLMMRRFERIQEQGIIASYETLVFGNEAQSFAVIFSNVAMVAMVGAGAIMVISHDLTIGALSACTLLAGRAVQPVVRLLNMWGQIQGVQIARTRLAELQSLDKALPADAARRGPLRGEIRLEGVRFRHPGAAGPLLNGVNLAIRPGEFVALRGNEGAGKTTLLRLVSGELVPGEGRVLIDGLDAHLAPRSGPAGGVVFVPQRAVILQGTILDNLTVFRRGEIVEQALAAARAIGVEADIQRLPLGYDTPLLEGTGEELAQGLLQRIAIARALAHNPRVLLFDESNAALDARADRQLQAALTRLKRTATIVMITGRPSYLRIADRICEMRGGRLHSGTAELGTETPELAFRIQGSFGHG